MKTVPPAAELVLPWNVIGLPAAPFTVLLITVGAYEPVSIYTTSPAARDTLPIKLAKVALGVAGVNPLLASLPEEEGVQTSPSLDPSST